MKAVNSSVPPADRPVCPALVRCFLLAATGLALGGCATTYEVKIDSLAKPNAENAVSYQINNKNPMIAEDSLRYKEASDYVKTALSGKGLYEAPAKVKPDIVVDLDYGIKPPESRRETVTEPVYITIPGQIRQERVQVGTDAQGRPIYQTVTVQDPPTTEFAGYRDYQVTVTVYEKYLRLTARENGPAVEGRPPAEIWTVDVTSEGQSRDLRKNLPILVAASIDYIGKDTHGQKSIKMKDTDRDVGFVKKGL